MSFDPVSYLMGTKASGGGGGGNPNYIETIEGTLANPWGTDDADEKAAFVTDLAQKIDDNEASATLQASGLIFAVWTNSGNLAANGCRVYRSGPTAADYVGGVDARYDRDGTLELCFASTDDTNWQWVDILNNAGFIDTALTIIHHPLPDSGT